jgi:hypothetical protein
MQDHGPSAELSAMARALAGIEYAIPIKQIQIVGERTRSCVAQLVALSDQLPAARPLTFRNNVISKEKGGFAADFVIPVLRVPAAVPAEMLKSRILDAGGHLLRFCSGLDHGGSHG